MKRITDLNGIFLRDSIGADFNEEIELMVNEPIPDTIYTIVGVCPKWDGERWIQNVPAPIVVPEPPEPTAEERLAGLEQALLDMMGGMLQ